MAKAGDEDLVLAAAVEGEHCPSLRGMRCPSPASIPPRVRSRGYSRAVSGGALAEVGHVGSRDVAHGRLPQQPPGQDILALFSEDTQFVPCAYAQLLGAAGCESVQSDTERGLGDEGNGSRLRVQRNGIGAKIPQRAALRDGAGTELVPEGCQEGQALPDELLHGRGRAGCGGLCHRAPGDRGKGRCGEAHPAGPRSPHASGRSPALPGELPISESETGSSGGTSLRAGRVCGQESHAQTHGHIWETGTAAAGLAALEEEGEGLIFYLIIILKCALCFLPEHYKRSSLFFKQLLSQVADSS